MSKIIYWLFTKTAFGKLIDGKKTEIGFLLLVLGEVIKLLTQGVAMLPQYAVLAQALVILQQVNSVLGDALTNVGLSVMVVGVGHKAIKENQDK